MLKDKNKVWIKIQNIVKVIKKIMKKHQLLNKLQFLRKKLNLVFSFNYVFLLYEAKIVMQLIPEINVQQNAISISLKFINKSIIIRHFQIQIASVRSSKKISLLCIISKQYWTYLKTTKCIHKYISIVDKSNIYYDDEIYEWKALIQTRANVVLCFNLFIISNS